MLHDWRTSASAIHVPGRGLEPLRIAPPDPKSGASANFATLALSFYEGERAAAANLSSMCARICARKMLCKVMKRQAVGPTKQRTSLGRGVRHTVRRFIDQSLFP